MATQTEIRNMANRIRSAKQNIESARVRFKSCADATPRWWKDRAEATFTIEKLNTLQLAKDLISEMNDLDAKMVTLGDAVRQADEEKKASKPI